MYVIETERLTKKYQPPKGLKALLIKSALKKEITAVDNISLQVKKGEVFGFLGPNGAGKTTLIKILSTLLLPTSGKATINGFNVVSQEDQVKNSIGLVTSEERSFYWRLTGRQNLNFFASLYGISPVDSKERIESLLKKLDLLQAADNMFYSYSSGMKQKLALVRGLLCNPAILFLDEPTKSVDVLTAQDLRLFIRETLAGEEKRTVFLTTHRLEEAEALCDRLAIINKGKLCFCGTVNELRSKTKIKNKFSIVVENVTPEVLKEVCAGSSIGSLKIITEDTNRLKAGFTVLNGVNPLSLIIEGILAKGGKLVSCNEHTPKLEELFTDFIKERSDVVS